MNQSFKWKILDFIECGQHYSINLETAEIRNNKTGRILKPKSDKDGYLTLGLYLNGKQKWYRVHILMYKAHYGDYDATKYVIDHINHVKTDNNIENLRLATISLNAINMSQTRGRTFDYKSYLPDAYTINDEHGIFYCKIYDKFFRKVSESQYREIHEEKVSRNTTRITWTVNGKKYRYTTTSIRQTLL